MELSVKGLRVMITAGASGIGRTVAETFLENGARVHICDIDEKSLTECRSSLPEIGTTVCDVSAPAQVDRFFQEAETFLGGLDVLINGAGIAGPTGPVEEISPEDWERTMAICVNGQFYCARRAAPLLRATGGGSIVNFSSCAGLLGYPYRSPYATAKWAVIGFTKTLAMELGKFGIRVNAICPGSVEGPRMDAVIAAEAITKGVSEETVRKTIVQGTSMLTFVSAADVANMLLYLCSSVGNKISGQAVSVDGHTEILR